MSIEMERSRDGYRGRYRDRHHTGSTSRNHQDDRSTRGNYREHLIHDNDHNSNYPPRNSSTNGHNYRSSRTLLNSRPVLSRNGPSTHSRHYRDDDYSLPSHPSSSSSNRASSGNGSQSNYYDKHPTSSRFDRPSNHRDLYTSLASEQPMLSNGLPIPTSSYYSSSSQSLPLLRDRALLPLPPPTSQYIDIERHRYLPPPPPLASSSSLSSTYRRDNSPPLVSSYRNERSMEYGSRQTNNDLYMRANYRSPTPPTLAALSARVNPHGDTTYRPNDYSNRSERYDVPSTRNNTASRDYPMPPGTYRNDVYRSSSNVSMSPPPSSFLPRESYPPDINYRPIPQPRDYENLSASSRASSMDHQDSVSRNSRDRNHTDYHSSYRDRPSLKRSNSRYDDHDFIPNKRPMRR